MKTLGRPLDAVLAVARERAAELRRQGSLEAWEARAQSVPPARDFFGALARPGPALIAEIKRQSPSRGPLWPDLDAGAVARAYEEAGAAALSVLTEPSRFGGSSEDLAAARSAVSLPVLCKDFVVDPVQVFAARTLGADAVLVIARVLEGEAFAEALDAARLARVACLVEVHDQDELQRALVAGAEVIGVNARDLGTLEVAPEVHDWLAPREPHEGWVYVAESGIETGARIAQLAALGYDAFLVGTALVSSRRPGEALRVLLCDAAASGDEA